jgi:hypothetical protein
MIYEYMPRKREGNTQICLHWPPYPAEIETIINYSKQLPTNPEELTNFPRLLTLDSIGCRTSRMGPYSLAVYVE